MNATTHVPAFNRYGVLAIYRFEMARARRTLWQSLVTPVITTSLMLEPIAAPNTTK